MRPETCFTIASPFLEEKGAPAAPATDHEMGYGMPVTRPIPGGPTMQQNLHDHVQGGEEEESDEDDRMVGMMGRGYGHLTAAFAGDDAASAATPLGPFATWQAERAIGDHDRNTLRLRLDPEGDRTAFEPGMTVWLKR
jgi:hypothetical protein